MQILFPIQLCSVIAFHALRIWAFYKFYLSGPAQYVRSLTLEELCITALSPEQYLLHLCRAPGISVYSYHGTSKRERERALVRVQRRGGVLLTTYGMVLTNHEQLSQRDGSDFVWVSGLDTFLCAQVEQGRVNFKPEVYLEIISKKNYQLLVLLLFVVVLFCFVF